MRIELGAEVRCIVSGFTGLATSRVEYFNGCTQYGVKPKVNKKDGKEPDTVYFDEGYLEVIGKGISIKQKNTGGDMTDRPQR